MSNLFERVRMRCHDTDVEFIDDEVEGNEYEGYSGHFCITFPCGRERLETYFSEEHEARLLLEHPFEDFKGIERHQATWSPAYGVVECNILGADGLLFSSADSKHERLKILERLGADVSSNPYNRQDQLRLASPYASPGR